MPLQIIKKQIVPATAEAVVKPVYPERSIPLFGPRVGRVTLSNAGKPAFRGELLVICPTVYDEGKIRLCYANCLKAAEQHEFRSLAIPLLIPGEGHPLRKQALQIALDAIETSPIAQRIQVCLMIPERYFSQVSQPLRQDLSAYIASNYQTDISWSPLPFPADADRYDTAVAFPMSAPPSPSIHGTNLGPIVEGVDAGFSETLLNLITRTGKKDSDIYTKANVSRQHFSKIRNNPDYRPTKPTAIAFAIALELDMEQTKDLIGRAGFALTRSSKFDLIIMYFIEQRNYDMFAINEVLYEFDQSLLCV